MSVKILYIYIYISSGSDNSPLFKNINLTNLSLPDETVFDATLKIDKNKKSCGPDKIPLILLNQCTISLVLL